MLVHQMLWNHFSDLRDTFLSQIPVKFQTQCIVERTIAEFAFKLSQITNFMDGMREVNVILRRQS